MLQTDIVFILFKQSWKKKKNKLKTKQNYDKTLKMKKSHSFKYINIKALFSLNYVNM